MPIWYPIGEMPYPSPTFNTTTKWKFANRFRKYRYNFHYISHLSMELTLSLPLALPCPCDASDKTLSLLIHYWRSTLSASDRFASTHQDVLAKIRPRVALPLPMPLQKHQACSNLAVAYRWVRRSLTLCRTNWRVVRLRNIGICLQRDPTSDNII